MKVLSYAIGLVGLTAVNLYNYFHTNGFVHVEIDKGILRGCNATTWSGKIYSSFKGIPFAKPPLDEFRFKAPREETAWAGVRDAINHGEICPQIDYFFGFIRGNEDCLFLNVYTPYLMDERLPVMVWIHGGMFMLSSSNDELYGPDYFMEAGVVLVTIHYRLGPLGFLSTEDDDAPGNAGMKDQVAALKWVRRNIAKFGGDPDNVTIFGGSSGATCVHYHLLSPMSSGLFNRAIAHSGSAIHTWALSQNGPEVTIRLAEALGAKDVAGNKTKAFQFLMTASPEDMVKAQQAIMTSEEERILTLFLFKPSIEKNVKSEEVFLPDSPLNIVKSGKFNKVPLIIGYNNQEGYFFIKGLENDEAMKTAFEDTERYVPADIKNNELRNDIAKSIRRFYFHDKPIGLGNISNLVDVYTDTVFFAGMNRAIELHLKSVNTPTYFYVFSYDGGLNLFKSLLNIDRPGAIHGDEIGYLFYSRLFFWKTPPPDSSDEFVLNTMIRLWINFAKFGNPTPPGDPLTWRTATLDSLNYLNISGWDTKLGINPFHQRSSFWKKAYEKSSENPKNEECLAETREQSCWQFDREP